jgi:hypothetical protein
MAVRLALGSSGLHYSLLTPFPSRRPHCPRRANYCSYRRSDVAPNQTVNDSIHSVFCLLGLNRPFLNRRRLSIPVNPDCNVRGLAHLCRHHHSRGCPTFRGFSKGGARYCRSQGSGRRTVPRFLNLGDKSEAVLESVAGFLGRPPLRGASSRKVDCSRASTNWGVPAGRPVWVHWRSAARSVCDSPGLR